MPSKPKSKRTSRTSPSPSRRRAASRKSSAQQQATRGAEPAPTSQLPVLDTPRELIPRQRRKPTPEHQERAAQNLLSALGGPDAVVPRLRASGKKSALRLADLLSAADFDRATFFSKVHEAGTNLVEFTETLLEVNGAAAVARLVMSADQIAEQILERAKDQIVPHRACLQSGRLLHESDEGVITPTDTECFDCQGTGYVVKSAEKEWVDLWLELVKLRKNQTVIDNRRMAQFNTQMNFGDLTAGDGAPSVDSIIRRADEQIIRIPSDRQLTAPASLEMPEDVTDDDAVEAEVVESSAV